MSSSFTCVSGQSRHTTCILPVFIRYCRFETSFSVIFHTQLCTNVQREAKTNSLADPLPIWPYSYHHGEARVAGLRSLPSGWPLYAFVAETLMRFQHVTGSVSESLLSVKMVTFVGCQRDMIPRHMQGPVALWVLLVHNYPCPYGCLHTLHTCITHSSGNNKAHL